jgi:hypothetical protein
MQRLLFAVVLSSLGWQQASAPAAFDPAGKWTFTTTSDQGAPMNGTFEVIGTPGNFKGQAITSEGRTLPVRSVMTAPNGFIMIVDLPSSSLVIQLNRDAAGKFTGVWGEIEQTFPVTATRAGK